MAAITKVPSRGKTWRATINMPGVKEFSKSFVTKKNAQAWVKKTEADLETARIEGNGLARNLTLSKLIETLTSVRTLNHSTVTALTWWNDNYGHHLCLQIDKTMLREARQSLQEGKARRGHGKGKSEAVDKPRSNATINRYTAALSTAWEYGREEYDLPDNPVRLLKALKESKGRIRWLSEDEKKSLLKACQASKWDRLYLLVTMAITTGARQGELLRLTWADLDLTARRAYVYQTKNGEPRVLPLTESIITQLQALPRPLDGSTLLFPSKRAKGKQFEFRKHWDDAVTTAGIENFRFHDLRHTCASYLAQNGASLLQIAEVLGHKQMEVTKRYSHLCVDHKQTLIDNVMGGVV